MNPASRRVVASGVETAEGAAGAERADAEAGILAAFALRDPHLRLTQVVLQDQTDVHNELVQTREWLLHPAETVELEGNLFVLENVLTGEGRVLLRLEPLPHARAVRRPVDLRVRPLPGGGVEVTVFGDAKDAGALADLPFSGGRFGRIQALQDFQRRLRPETPSHRIPRFLSNTWGDRSRDSRINRDFIAKEIEAGARLGVEVVQIDDGWQTGVSANSSRAAGGGAWEGFWRNREDFWAPDPQKFPDGLAPLVRQAAGHGMELGLWFAPDSSDGFASWERDAACLLEFHRAHGIRHFKMDGIHAPDARAQGNLRRLFDRLREASAGELVFDLDVTAQLRPGYFGLTGAGPLFVENRYTDWHRYWPHQTLRNLWQLAEWVDPGRLRMEFLNHARNGHLYAEDPLAPASYAPEALFATVFFSNPLGWFEVSNLPPGYIERVAPLVRLWKHLRPTLFSGTIVPLGEPPDGVAWTGLASVACDGASAIVLAFRELHPDRSARFSLPGCRTWRSAACEVLKSSLRNQGELGS
jgi:alpha-galactosidase